MTYIPGNVPHDDIMTSRTSPYRCRKHRWLDGATLEVARNRLERVLCYLSLFYQSPSLVFGTIEAGLDVGWKVGLLWNCVIIMEG